MFGILNEHVFCEVAYTRETQSQMLADLAGQYLMPFTQIMFHAVKKNYIHAHFIPVDCLCHSKNHHLNSKPLNWTQHYRHFRSFLSFQLNWIRNTECWGDSKWHHFPIQKKTSKKFWNSNLPLHLHFNDNHRPLQLGTFRSFLTPCSSEI
jgi:hypothetical protein